MTVVVPCDCVEVRKATKAVYEHSGPVYLRIDRMPVPFVYESMENCEFKLGKANVLREGSDVTIISSGYPVALAVKAAEQAQKEGISADVFDVHTVKPLDQKAIIKSAKKTGAVVTVEEHSVIGALGGAVAEVLGEKFPVPIKRIGVKDRFGESALDWNELMSAYGITVEAIVDASRDILKRKTV
jgi:transketolase